MVKFAKKINPFPAVFRLSPVMMAIALIAPFNVQAVENSNIQLLDQHQAEMHRFHRDHVIGTSLDVVMTGVSKQEAKTAFNAIEAEIARLDQILSTWRHDSEITALNQNNTHKTQVSPELFEVIAACENWRAQSCGAFDARLGELISAWEKSQGVAQVDAHTHQQILDHLESTRIELDADALTIKSSQAVKFAPDAYAKGYIIDRALAAARTAVPSLEGLLVDLGGDMRVWGAAPQKTNGKSASWNVGVQDAFNHFDNTAPSQVLSLNDQAIAFSGKGYRNLNGETHLLDPKTGQALQQVEQCVVVGTCAADADALATALAAMTPSEGLALVDALVGYESQLITADGQIFQSRGWNNLVQLEEQGELRNVANTNSAKWPTGYQAILDVTIPKIDVEKYRAPYVNVWITDSDKKLVRTLAVWGKDDKWINSNYVWWRRYGRQMTNLDAVAKPSRQPGHYKLAWDGKDDHGKAVKAGQYQIHIETAREHGDHSYQTMTLDVKAKASNQTLAAQKEIGAVKLNFQKVN